MRPITNAEVIIGCTSGEKLGLLATVFIAQLILETKVLLADKREQEATFTPVWLRCANGFTCGPSSESGHRVAGPNRR
jgi:hypothetical protein